MKRIMFFITTIVVIGIFSTISVKAVNCDYPYCGDWEPAGELTYPNNCEFLTYNATCSYEVYFRTRTCIFENDTLRQIKIERLEIYPDGGECPDDDDLLKQAIEWMLFTSPWKLGITNPLNEFDVSILIPACMKRVTVFLPPNDTERDKISICDFNAGCCSATYTLQRVDNYMYIRDSEIESSNDNITCVPGVNNDCEKICSTLSFNDDYQIDFQFGLQCDYPCPNTEFSQQNTKLYSHTLGFGGNACTYYIDYGIRECEDLDEIAIKSIGAFTGNKSYWGMDDFLNGAIQELLGNVYDIFGLTPPCNVVVRTHSCWRVTDDDIGWMYPCGNATCCSSTYSITSVGGTLYSSTITHDPGTYMPCANDCANICDAHLMENEEVPFQDPTIIEEFKANYNIGDVQIIPHPASGNTEIIFYDKSNGEAEIVIYNFLGKKVYSYIEQKNSDKIIFNINASKMNDGIYYFNIKINNEIKCKRSMIIK